MAGRGAADGVKALCARVVGKSPRVDFRVFPDFRRKSPHVYKTDILLLAEDVGENGALGGDPNLQVGKLKRRSEEGAAFFVCTINVRSLAFRR